MKPILALLLLCSTALAQPKLIIVNDQSYRPFGAVVWSNSFFISLRSFATNDCSIHEGCAHEGINKILVFGVTVGNVGNSDLTLPTIEQRPDLFEFDTCHGHIHLLHFSKCDLLDCSGSVVVSSQKIGWCLASNLKLSSNAPANTYKYYCEHPGLQQQWGDTYNGVNCMWMDITTLPDGQYVMRETIDPQNLWGIQTTVTQPVSIQGMTITNIAALSCAPAAPSLFSVSTSKWSNALRWRDNSGNEQFFELQRKNTPKKGGESAWLPLAFAPANSTNYTDTDVRPNYTYAYRLRAVNSSGASAWVP